MFAFLDKGASGSINLVLALCATPTHTHLHAPQVFAFLDKGASGSINLAAVLEEPPECLEDLDDDVSGVWYDQVNVHK